MTAILQPLPFRQEADEVSCGLDRVRIKPYQIIVWVSVAEQARAELPPQALRIPAILDTGHSHNFSIQQRQLTAWSRLDLAVLRQRGTITVAGRSVQLHAAAVWIHPNEPGQRDRFRDLPPFRLKMPLGIAVHPLPAGEPRLPLLGLRALVHNKLHLSVDAERCLVHLRAPGWRTRLLRWLA